MSDKARQENGLPSSWVWVAIGEIARVNGRDTSIASLTDDLLVTFLPMSSVDAFSGTIAHPEERRLADVRKGYTSFSEGDVLFAKITPSMENGKAAIAEGLGNGRGFGSTEFHVLSPTEGVTSEWLFYFIRQECFRADARASFSGTAGQLRVPASFIEKSKIPLAPLPEQHRIVAEVERRLSVVQEVEATVAANLKRAERLRQSILKQAFEGKLVPQNSNDEPAFALLERIRSGI